MTRTTCSKCHGRGFYFGPYYGDLHPKTEKLVCGCRNTRPLRLPRPVREIAIVSAIAISLLAFLAAGAQ